jgi:ssDNA-binding Zn-finger/Zn-ribbon topoisomerase 1
LSLAVGSGAAVGAGVETEGYTSARICGQCHEDIYDSWKDSLHAYSLTDPIFDGAYMQALKEAGDAARRLCLQCHAPMVMQNGDYELRLGVTREGVSCDFCHTVTAVHLDRRENRYSVEPGLVKRSVIEKTSSPAHEVAHSELHSTSEFCGGCHNSSGPGGRPIMGTYDEWKNGPYVVEGVQCQDCHMTLSAGRVVREEVQDSGTEIHLHSLIQDTDQLRSALTVQIDRAARTFDRLQLDVVVENVGSGHMVPTGIPSREVVLTVNVEVGGRVLTQE